MAKYREVDLLSAAHSPPKVNKQSGVRRVNNMPVYLVGGLLILFLIVMVFVAIHRAHHSQDNVAQNLSKQSDDASSLALSITGNRTDGFVPSLEQPAAPTSKTGDVAVPIAIPPDMNVPPLPSRLKEASDAESEHIHQEKMQLFESAVKGKTGVNFQALHVVSALSDSTASLQRAIASQNTAPADDVNTNFTAHLHTLQAQRNGDSHDAASSQRNNISQFDAKDKKDRWQLDNSVEAPKTPYTLRAGFMISATLISGINSELPGQIIGQVSQNVFDTATGKYLLIPQGARLVGTYTSDVSYGQSRVMIAWQRIVFPDGKALDIGAMPGADGAGYSGFNDQVDNHYLRIFGSAILMSGINAGVSLSQENNSSGLYGQPSTGSVMSEALGQQLGSVTSQMINKNLSISPTLEIRPGFRFNVMCVKDLVFNAPYQAFDY